MKNLILIDGYGIVFKAFFSMKDKYNNGERDKPIGALLGFTIALVNILKNQKYSHIAVAFDTGKPNFRHAMYNKYKANRPPCADELKQQFPLVREVVKALNIVSLEKDGYEADDIIATYTKNAVKQGFSVKIVSIDKDLMQLVDDNVVLYDVYDRVGDGIFDEKRVKKKWEVEPKQILDILSLMGDSSDNIPGVPGIGIKTAIKLINEYNDIDTLLDNLHLIKKDKIRESLKNNTELLELSRKLVKLDENVPLNYSIDDLSFQYHDKIKFHDFLAKEGLLPFLKYNDFINK
jgi:DNA polymerase-1